MDTIPHHAHEDKPSPKKHRTGPDPRPLAERFWEKVDIRDADECWEWQACKYHHGYGKFALTRSNAVYAHRVAFELANGPIPDNLLVCHTCDNRPCCNPHHLFTGTQKDNMQDCKLKGRISAPPRPPAKEGNPGWKDAEQIRTLYKTGNYRQVDLASMFHVNQRLISQIVRCSGE